MINNTIFGSGTEDGVIWQSDSGGIMLNNIILSNGNGNGDYGVQNLGSGTVVLENNIIFGHFIIKRIR